MIDTDIRPKVEIPKQILDSGMSPKDKNRIRDLIDVWIRRIEAPANGFRQVGAYDLKREDGKYPPIEIVHYSYKNSAFNREGMVLLAVDGNKQILGMRDTQFESLKADTLNARGNIEVFSRGIGIASALEALHFDILQKKLNKSSEFSSLEYKIFDANYSRIQELQVQLESAKRTIDPIAADLELELAEKCDHRNAWKRLYGEGGKLGFQKESGKLLKRFVNGQNQDHLGYGIEVMDDTLDAVSAFSALKTRINSTQNK